MEVEREEGGERVIEGERREERIQVKRGEERDRSLRMTVSVILLLSKIKSLRKSNR